MRTKARARDEAIALRRAATSLAARARVERAGELTLNQVAVLGRIATEGPITPRELGEELQMLPQSLTRPLASLDHAGLIRRMPDPADGRGALLEITEAGLASLRAEMAPRDRWVAAAVAAVCSEGDRDTLAAAAVIMQRLVDYGGPVAPVES